MDITYLHDNKSHYTHILAKIYHKKRYTKNKKTKIKTTTKNRNMKRGDPVLCKKNDYAGLSKFWLMRIFEKYPNTFLKKGETYYILKFDEDNIPNSVTMFTKKDFERYIINPSAAVQSPNVSSINWKNKTKNSKSYFSKYFYTNKYVNIKYLELHDTNFLTQMRKEKLKKLNEDCE
jgi:hypothetical protein